MRARPILIADPASTTAPKCGAAPRNEYTVIDLFAGCGGGSVGFRTAGFRVAAAVEIDPVAAESFHLNLGIKPLVEDIRSVDGPTLLKAAGLRRGECTVLFGCPPCQSYTVLRRAAPTTDLDVLRETLPDEYLRLVRAVRPRFIAFENVPGMRTGRGRVQFNKLEAELRRLGYMTNSAVIDVADFGVPQHRRRLVMVGGLRVAVDLPVQTHAAPPSGSLPAHRTVRDAIADLPVPATSAVAAEDTYHRARNHNQIALKRLRAIPEGGGRLDLPDDLQLECHRDHRGHYDVYGRMRWDAPAPTITSGCTNVTRGRFAHPSQHRAITIREAMLLQGFPETMQLWGTQDQMAQQVGNAVPPAVAQAVAAAIKAVASGASDQIAAATSRVGA